LGHQTCETSSRNDLNCVEWDVKPCSIGQSMVTAFNNDAVLWAKTCAFLASLKFDSVVSACSCVWQDEIESLPREPVKLDLPAELKQVLQRDQKLVRVKHSVTFCLILTPTAVHVQPDVNYNLSLWCSLLPYGYSCKASCARPG